METTEQIIRRLERQRDEMECILNRRDSYVEMIDWDAMTQEQRDWAWPHGRSPYGIVGDRQQAR